MHNQSERFQVNGEFRDTDNPENQLLAAVMFRAMCDATGAPCDQQVKRSAVNWLRLYLPLRPNKKPFSFWWVCEHLDLEPQFVKELVLDHIKKGQVIAP